jgi:hypothetical protein
MGGATMSRFELPAGATLIGPDMPDSAPRSPDPDMPVPRPAPIQELPETATPITEDVLQSTRPRQPNIIERSMESGALGRMGEDLQQRVENVERGSQAYQEGEIGYPQFALYGFANAWGALADVVGESAMTILDGLTWGQGRDFLEETIAAGGTKLMNTDTAKAALEWYDSLTDTQRDLVTNIGEMSLGAAPVRKIADVGGKVKQSGIEADKSKMSSWVLDQSKGAREERISEGGRTRDKQNRINKEDRILDTLISLDIKGNTPATTALNKINFEVSRLSRQVDEALKKSFSKNRIRIPKAGVQKAVDFRLNGFLANNKRFVEDSKLSGYVKKAQTALEDALEQYDGTPAGLLQLRRRFDSNIKDVLADDVFDGPNVSSRPVREMREAINSLMMDMAPNDDIRAMMRRQHHLLDAEMNITVNEAKKGKRNIAQKALDLAERHPFAAASALQGGGIFSNIPEGAVLAGSAALGGYGLMQPGVRRVAGQTLSDLPVMRGIGMTAATPGEEPQQ